MGRPWHAPERDYQRCNSAVQVDRSAPAGREELGARFAFRGNLQGRHGLHRRARSGSHIGLYKTGEMAPGYLRVAEYSLARPRLRRTAAQHEDAAVWNDLQDGFF